jgi:hypothetical protein
MTQRHNAAQTLASAHSKSHCPATELGCCWLSRAIPPTTDRPMVPITLRLVLAVAVAALSAVIAPRATAGGGAQGRRRRLRTAAHALAHELIVGITTAQRYGHAAFLTGGSSCLRLQIE